MAKKESARKERSKKDYYGKGFFAVPRINLPQMKSDSSYQAWSQCVRKTFEFFDGKNQGAFILELCKLEESLCKLNQVTENAGSAMALLINTLCNFEK